MIQKGLLKLEIAFILFILGFSSLSLWANTPTPCSLLEKNEHALLQNCSGQKVLILRGNAQERAVSHGLLFKNQLSADVANYFTDKISEELQILPNFIKKIAESWVGFLARSQQKMTPPYYQDSMKWLAESAGIPQQTLDIAMSAPDFGSWSWAATSGFFSLPKFGCTSVGIFDKDQMFYGRNLDFPGTQILDRHSLLIVHHPTEPKELKRAAFVADGIHFAGVSAFNEAGLGILVHQSFSDRSTLTGYPIMMLLDFLLASSRSIDDVIALLQKNRPGPMWTLVIIDFKKREIATAEVARNVLGIRRSPKNEVFAQTNHLLTPEAQPYEWISEPLLRNSRLRYDKAIELANKTKSHSIERVAEILSYKEGEFTVYNDIEKPSTVHSVMVEARNDEEPTLYISREMSPSASGAFLKINWKTLFSDSDQWSTEIIQPLNLTLRARQNLVNWSEAFRAYEDTHKPEMALRLTQDTNNPGIQLFRAVIFYELSLFTEARNEAQLLINNPLAPKFIIEEGKLIQWMSFFREDQKEAALLKAQELLKFGISSKHWNKITEKFVQEKSLSDKELKLKYDTFAGQIDSPPGY